MKFIRHNLRTLRKTAFLFMTLVMTAASAQQKPTTGYAPVNELRMDQEAHAPDTPKCGKTSEPVVLHHDGFVGYPQGVTYVSGTSCYSCVGMDIEEMVGGTGFEPVTPSV